METALALALVCDLGIVTGVLTGVAVGVVPAFAAMTPGDYVRTHHLVGRHFDRVMPPAVVTAIGVAVILAATTSGAPRILAVLTAVAAAGVATVSQAGNVPINRRVRSTDPRTVDPDRWDDPRGRWRTWHLLRTALAVAAMVAAACVAATL